MHVPSEFSRSYEDMVRVTRSSRLGDYSSVVAAGHNELWQPLATNRLSVTSQMLWPMATPNCHGLRPQELDLE